jgi:putative inorganic carbon (hco3(-)) transporter
MTGLALPPRTPARPRPLLGRLPLLDRRPRTGGVVVVALLVAITVAVTVLAGQRPTAVVIGLVALAALGVMVARFEAAVIAYVAVAPFGDALKSASSISIKAVGAVLVLAWLVSLLRRHRPVPWRNPTLQAAGALALVLLAATVVHANGSAGLTVLGRYLSYLGILAILIDAIDGGLPVRRIAAVYLCSCTVAAGAGVVHFLVAGDGRASGPMADPNDFAFYLVAAVPFAMAFARRSRRLRYPCVAAAALLLLAIALTFSRGAILGVLAMVLLALLTRQLRVGAVVAAALLLGLGAGVLVTADPTLVRDSVAAKQHVAGQNVDDRLTTWTMAAEMTADSPLLGKGPAGFATNFDAYLGTRETDPAHLDVAHQMYLDVASELGLAGLAAFLAVIVTGLAGAWRAARQHGDAVAAGVVTAFVGVLVAASFLSEQYYLPVWLLAALGAGLGAGVRARTGARRPILAAPEQEH